VVQVEENKRTGSLVFGNWDKTIFSRLLTESRLEGG
jgi:hypothetical protein